MASPRFTEADVGEFYVGEAGDLWRLIGFADRPTATLERVTPPATSFILGHRERRGGVVGAPIFEGFRKLVPEEPT